MLALVLGGARSGKSRYAASVARALSPSPVMLATSRVWDDDHKARIERHRADRGSEWTTIEEPVAIARPELVGRVVVVDCVTLWLTNLFADAEWSDEAAHQRAVAELERVEAINATFIFVSNELGMAPHADAHITRKFVDVQGFVNQTIAAKSAAVALTVAGFPLAVRGGDMQTALSQRER